MSDVSPTKDHSGNADTQGPVEQLLRHTEQVLDLESRLRTARVMRRFARVTMILIPAGILGIYIPTAITWDKVDLKPITIPAGLAVAGMGLYLWFYLHERYFSETSTDYDVAQLELQLDLAQERRRLQATGLNLDITTRQMIYRDSIPQDIERYRGESKHYRRVHNALQAIIIVGALAASTLTSLIQSVPSLRWFAVGTTFSVGVAAGFTGYYKFRERSFYLQLTSDAIEHELSAVTLGIGRYKDKAENDALTEFTEQAELLKIEQRKRQQQLEQPSEGHDGVQ